MKQSLKNEEAMLNLINQIQTQLIALDKKLDTIIHRSIPENKQIPKPAVNTAPSSPKPNDHGRVMYKAICADCNKECTIPFKPSGDRPIYCQDCFSRRKVIRLSGMKVEDRPKLLPAQAPVIKEIVSQKTPVKSKKKTVTVKKPIGKKKTVPKKK